MEQRKMDYHLHTFHSMDGRQSLDELCQAMARQGVEEICLTEHLDLGHPDPSQDIPPIWDVWLRELQQARVSHPGLTICAGVEIGDNPARREEIRAVLDDLPLDFRLLSLHVVGEHDCWEPAYYAGKTRDEAYRAYVAVLVDSLRAWEDFESLAHVGYVAKFAPYEGDQRPLVYGDAPDAFDEILRTLVEKDKCLEVNTSGYGATGDVFPHASILKRYIELGGECFTFGSDSHDTARDYADIERAKDAVRALGGKYQASFRRRKKMLYRI